MPFKCVRGLSDEWREFNQIMSLNNVINVFILGGWAMMGLEYVPGIVGVA